MPQPPDFSEDPSGLESPHAEIHLSDYWAVLVKYRFLILGLVAGALIAGILTTVFSQKMYRATIVLDIVRQQGNPLGLSQSFAEDSGNDPEFLPSQIELLKSRDVAERVVRRLNLLSNVAFNPDVSRPGARPLPPPSPQQVADAAMGVKGGTEASTVRGTSLVRVSYQSTSPQLAADVANAIADAYIEWNIESRFRQVGLSAQFLGKQIEQAKKEIAVKEHELLSYSRQKSADGSADSSDSQQKVESLNRDYSMAVADRVAKEARYQELQNTPAETIAEAAASGLLAQLRADQSRLERDYAERLNLYKPEWPAMQQLKKQVDDGRQRLQSAIQDTAGKAREAARADYQTALRRESNIQGMMRTQQSEALSPNASEYNALKTEVETKRTLLDSLIKQQGEAEVVARLREQQLTNVRIVDRALVPYGPFQPRPVRNVGMALALGLALGVGLALLLSYLDRSVRSADDVERFLQLPALGAIPEVGKSKAFIAVQLAGENGEPPQTSGIELMPNSRPRSAVAEAYRAFRTALLFSRAGGVRIVAITSVLPQEGKSSTAVNLAVVLAQLGRRVLLVDADLHRSRVHQVMGVPNTVGLVSILAEGLEPSRVIARTNVPGVYVVPAGPETPNPSALLSSEDMQKFLELAATNFDHVIVDTPPLLATSDVLVFAQHTDGVVICVRAGSTLREQVRRVRDKLLRGGVPILGVLLSGIRVDSDYYGGYDYRYLNYGEKSTPEDRAAPAKSLGSAS